jgi:hypothetical protein
MVSTSNSDLPITSDLQFSQNFTPFLKKVRNNVADLDLFGELDPDPDHSEMPDQSGKSYQIRKPDQSEKLDQYPDPHQRGKQDPDSDQHQSGKQVSKPYQST